MESVLNRASARGKSLGDTIYDPNYYPATTFNRMGGRMPQQASGLYGSLLNDVMGGSNVAGYGTGNASGTVGFAGGPQTAAYGGERYGVEGKDRSWAQRVAQLSNDGLNEVGPNGLQPLHPEIYASTAQSAPGSVASVSSPPTPSLPGPRPMDLPSLPAQPPGLLSRLGVDRPGWLDDVKTTLNTPLAQQGLGLLFAGMSGHDPNAGMTAGAQRASTMTNDLLHRMQVERTLQRQAIADNLVRNLPNNPALAGSLPKEVIAGISALPPDVAADVYGKGILARQQADINNKAAASQRQQMVDTLLAFRKQMEDEAKRGPRQTPQGAPSGGQWAPDGNYYVPNPQAPGKYLMWKD
jgi:hypothetical protein